MSSLAVSPYSNLSRPSFARQPFQSLSFKGLDNAPHFSHQSSSLKQQLKHGGFHLGLCVVASSIGHFYFDGASHDLSAYLVQAPWFEAFVDMVNPDAAATPRMFGGEMAATHQAAHKLSHIVVGCVGPTAVLETAAIVAPPAAKKVKSWFSWFRPKKSPTKAETPVLTEQIVKTSINVEA